MFERRGVRSAREIAAFCTLYSLCATQLSSTKDNLVRLWDRTFATLGKTHPHLALKTGLPVLFKMAQQNKDAAVRCADSWLYIFDHVASSNKPLAEELLLKARALSFIHDTPLAAFSTGVNTRWSNREVPPHRRPLSPVIVATAS